MVTIIINVVLFLVIVGCTLMLMSDDIDKENRKTVKFILWVAIIATFVINGIIDTDIDENSILH